MSATVRHWPRGYPCNHEGKHLVHAAQLALKHATGESSNDDVIRLFENLPNGRYRLGEYVYMLVKPGTVDA